MILYAIDATQSDPFYELVVCSPDTNVFLLLIFFCKDFCNHTVFQTGGGNSERDIDIGTTYEALGVHRCKVLVGFHSFTGYDQTAKFYIKSKLGCWKTFIHSPAEVLEAFSQLGEDLDEFQPCVSDSLSLFILDLYCKLHSKLAREIPFLRWHLYMRLQVESELLSPSPSALQLKIKGSHYVTKIWRSSSVSILVLPRPDDFSCKVTNGNYELIATDLQPVPGAVSKLSFCCCNTRCFSLRYSRR